MSDIREIFKKWAAAKFTGLVHIELADDLDTWCVKTEEESLLRCHDLDAARDAKELVCDFIGEIVRSEVEYDALRTLADGQRQRAEAAEKRLAAAERLNEAHAREDEAQMARASAEFNRAEAAEAREAKLREALEKVVKLGEASFVRDIEMKRAEKVAREALAATSAPSGITDSHRLSVCEHMGWTIQKIGNQWMVQLPGGRWIDANTLRLALDAAIERTPTHKINEAIAAKGAVS